MCNHRVHKCMGARPKRSHKSNQTLSGYWEVNGMRAHCLLDSGCMLCTMLELPRPGVRVGSGRIRLGVRTDVASVSRSLC